MVEYWPMLENFQEFKENFVILDRFYKENLYLMDFRAAKELIHVYCMFSRIYDYYIYTSTVRMKDGNPIEQSDVEKIMAVFLPKVGIFLDWDFTVMQAKLEKKLVKGVYKPSFARNSKVASEEWCKNYGLKRYAKTNFMLAEKELFAALITDICENQHISQEDRIALFAPNQYVQLTEWEGLWYE